MNLQIRSIQEKDKDFVRQALINLWGSDKIVYSGRVFDAGILPGFIANADNRAIGLLTYFVEGKSCQIISINALTPGKGIGTALLEKLKDIAKEKGCDKLLTITTNDAVAALAFYKSRGFFVKKIHKGAIALSRAIKPEIPLLGENGIPIEDEIELEMSLTD